MGFCILYFKRDFFFPFQCLQVSLEQSFEPRDILSQAKISHSKILFFLLYFQNYYNIHSSLVMTKSQECCIGFEIRPG